MSRKALFGQLADPAEKVAAEEVPARAARQRIRPILGAAGSTSDASISPVGAVGRSLEAVSRKARRAEDVERLLAGGQIVVELDPALVDTSFVADRMASPEAQADLVASILESGQQVPILVRPHPDREGRFQVAYGHRRLRAAAELGRGVRAVVKTLSDEELAVAQGQENNARRDLSYIEKARFARNLEERFGRKTVMSALSLYKSDLSNMLSVVSRIPDALVDTIGPAPGVGRRGWIELADAVAKKGSLAAVEKAVGLEGFAAKASDERFKLALSATRTKERPGKTKVLHDTERKEIGRIALSAARLVLTVDRRKASQFADFVTERLQDLYKEFEASSGGPDGVTRTE